MSTVLTEPADGASAAADPNSTERPPAWPHRHLLDTDVLTWPQVELVLDTADAMAEIVTKRRPRSDALRGVGVTNLFYEASTRTRVSFEVAAKHLSADVVNVSVTGSSIEKGESLLDTMRTLESLGARVLVIRHAVSGAPYLVAREFGGSVVNAGDGRHAHPTQALLDLYTLRQHLPGGSLRGRKVVILGDVLHSRVARSLIQALALMGAHVTLVGPPALLPRGIEAMDCDATTEIGTIGAADVVYVLRMQRERMQEGANYVPSLREYTARWGITPERLRPGQKVMHPGPMNRGVEIDPRVADHADALIETQVRAGLVTRMAVLYDLLTSGPVGIKTESVLEVA